MKTLVDKNGWVVRVSEELAPRMIAKGYQYCPKSKWKELRGPTPRAADLTDSVCYNGNHESKNGVCVVDGGIKPSSR